MAINVSHVDLSFVTVVSNTTTTDTTYAANPPDDRNYVFAADIVGMVNADVLLGGFGMFLRTTLAGGTIDMTNDGGITVDQPSAALELIGNGGMVTYAGTGSITNGDGNALHIGNSGASSIRVTANDTIESLNGAGIFHRRRHGRQFDRRRQRRVSGAIGIVGGLEATTVINLGSITGIPAVDLSAGNDTYDGRGGTVQGTVLGGPGDDLFFSGAGIELFSGGANVDTVDYAGATGPVTVSLATISATGHGNDVLSHIENVRGGSFGDTFIGDALANTFTGRGGDDTFVPAPGGGADTIEDFLAGPNTEDRVDVRAFADISSLDDVLALSTQAGPNTVIDFGSGDTLTLRNVTMTDLVDSDLILVPQLEHVLWRHDDGRVRTSEQDLGAVPNSWQVTGTGDFDGDGDADILWRHDGGAVVTWELEDGAFVTNHNHPDVPNSWQVAGTGDFDGDGDADIVWRNDDHVVTWEMQDGEFVTSHNLPAVPATWQVAETGDFDGDGDADILWRHDDGQVVTWEMQGGALVTNHSLPLVSDSFHIAGAGDFDGDGDADILWRHDGGAVVVWEMENGAFVVNHNQPDVAHTWHIQGTQDFDHDGDADILWRHDGGTVVTWDMEDGNFVQTDRFGVTANTWQIQGTGEFDL